jgi:hypothetical protein
LASAGGLLTLDATIEGSPDTWEATWARQGRGFEVVVERGFVARRGDNWLHSPSLEGIRRQEKILAKPKAKADVDVQSMSMEEIGRRFGRRAIKIPAEGETTPAGNCRSGVLAWVERNLKPTAEAWAARDPNPRTSATVAELVSWLLAGGQDQRGLVEREVRTAATR